MPILFFTFIIPSIVMRKSKIHRETVNVLFCLLFDHKKTEIGMIFSILSDSSVCSVSNSLPSTLPNG